ncbi:hypothetical protein INT44_001248 [Umbelopsis vinacea]|uniref:DHHA2 domain-containing protein n=1 Tax=Umbelopsis vinacea TaxID=44442 RepID=A0A8H7QAZ1_9FUNG|nr:hypothetical protein INT44_001248 [Umbelopsis vinacea]
MQSLNQFLNHSLGRVKEAIHTGSSKDSLYLITGNESGDLDSIASALTFAYLSDHKSKNKQDFFLPLVNIPKDDLALRPEAGFVLSKSSVDPQLLCYSDTIDLSVLSDVFEQIQLILVDHNKLANPFSLDEKKWSPLVSGIIDHHVDEHLYDTELFRTIKPSGSCSSLVTLHHEDVLQGSKDEQLESLAKLALAPILVDSVNLQPQYNRTTDDDVKAVNLLKQHVTLDSDTYFNDIQTAKSSIHHLNDRDLLRKDYKEWESDNGYKIGISAVPWYLQGWIERDNNFTSMVTALNNWADERELDSAYIMTAFDRENQGGFQRELLGLVRNEKLNGILQKMEQNQEIQLQRLTNDIYKTNSKHPLAVWRQQNIKWSRKQVWPFIRSTIESLEDTPKL